MKPIVNVRTIRFAVIAALGFSLMACGGGSSGSSPTPPSGGAAKMGNESLVCTNGTDGGCTLVVLQWLPDTSSGGAAATSVNYKVTNASSTTVASGVSNATAGATGAYIYGSSTGDSGNGVLLGPDGVKYSVSFNNGPKLPLN